MDPALFKTLREALGLTPHEVAKRLGVNIRTAQRWETTNTPTPEAVAFIVQRWGTYAFRVNQVMEYMEEMIEEHGEPQAVTMARYRDDAQAALAGEDMTAKEHAALLGHIVMALTREGLMAEVTYRMSEPAAE